MLPYLPASSNSLFDPLDFPPKTKGVPLPVRIGKGELAARRIGDGKGKDIVFLARRGHAAAAFEEPFAIRKLAQVNDVIHPASHVWVILRA